MQWAGWTDGPGLCAVVLPAVLGASDCHATAGAPTPDQAAAIDSAERLDLIRYPVFNVAQRADLKRQLRAALAAQARRRPA